MITPPTPAQLEAVRTYAAKRGNAWKQRLREDWQRSAYPGFDLETAARLQQLRNRSGPQWLATFRLEDTPA